MGEFLRRTDLVPPRQGEQRVHYWVKVVEGDTSFLAQTAANLYLAVLDAPAISIRGHLIDTQYQYIPPQTGPPVDERHIIKMTFATVGPIAFTPPV